MSNFNDARGPRGTARSLLYLGDARKIQMHVERDTGHVMPLKAIERMLHERNNQRFYARTLKPSPSAAKSSAGDEFEGMRSRKSAQLGCDALARAIANYGKKAA